MMVMSCLFYGLMLFGSCRCVLCCVADLDAVLGGVGRRLRGKILSLAILGTIAVRTCVFVCLHIMC